MKKIFLFFTLLLLISSSSDSWSMEEEGLPPSKNIAHKFQEQTDTDDKDASKTSWSSYMATFAPVADFLKKDISDYANTAVKAPFALLDYGTQHPWQTAFVISHIVIKGAEALSCWCYSERTQKFAIGYNNTVHYLSPQEFDTCSRFCIKVFPFDSGGSWLTSDKRAKPCL